MTILTNFPYRQKGELLGVIISAILALLLLRCSVFLIVVTPEDETIDPVILDAVGLAALFPFIVILLRRFSQATARETFLPVTPEQFSDIHEYLVAASEHFGLKTIPAASKTGFLGWLAHTFAEHPSAARRITKISQNR